MPFDAYTFTLEECDRIIEKYTKEKEDLQSQKIILQLKINATGADNIEAREELYEIQQKLMEVSNLLGSMEEGEEKQNMEIRQTRLTLRRQLLEKQLRKTSGTEIIRLEILLNDLHSKIERCGNIIAKATQRKNELMGLD